MEAQTEITPGEKMVRAGIKTMLTRKRKLFEEKLEIAKMELKTGLKTDKSVAKIHKADSNNGIFVNGARIATLQKYLREFDEALERVDKGIYGICTRCRKQIPMGRLMSVPFTEHCVPCKNKLTIV